MAQRILFYRLSEGAQALGEREKDLRNRRVLDRLDAEVGKVEDMIVDEKGWARFLLIRLGERGVLLPIEAVSESDAEAVYVSQPGERISSAPAYDAARTDDEEYWLSIYDHYDYSPYWTPGYGAG